MSCQLDYQIPSNALFGDQADQVTAQKMIRKASIFSEVHIRKGWKFQDRPQLLRYSQCNPVYLPTKTLSWRVLVIDNLTLQPCQKCAHLPGLSVCQVMAKLFPTHQMRIQQQCQQSLLVHWHKSCSPLTALNLQLAILL